MVKQKKRTRITQSGKNCAIESARLIWKQKISLVLTKSYCSLANHNPEFRRVICTVLHIFALVLHILHSFLSQSEYSNSFVYIIREITSIPYHFTRSIPTSLPAGRLHVATTLNLATRKNWVHYKRPFSAFVFGSNCFCWLIVALLKINENSEHDAAPTRLAELRTNSDTCGAVIGWKLLRNHSWSRLHCKSNTNEVVSSVHQH